jgi:hypothetical protein
LPWSTPFEDAVPLPSSRKLVTLKDATDYIAGLPKREAGLPEWQAAIEALMLAAEHGGPAMLARIGASCAH